MAVAQLLVYSNPAAGKEAEYNRWYDEQHIPDLLKIPGVIAAQRFTTDGGEWSYVTVYELDTADQAMVMEGIQSRVNTPAMVMSDAIDLETVKMVFCTGASPRQSR